MKPVPVSEETYEKIQEFAEAKELKMGEAAEKLITVAFGRLAALDKDRKKREAAKPPKGPKVEKEKVAKVKEPKPAKVAKPKVEKPAKVAKAKASKAEKKAAQAKLRKAVNGEGENRGKKKRKKGEPPPPSALLGETAAPPPVVTTAPAPLAGESVDLEDILRDAESREERSEA